MCGAYMTGVERLVEKHCGGSEAGGKKEAN